MPEITFNQAKEFLDNISNEDKVAVIHHDDGDGFCSGILYYNWCEKQKAEVEEFPYLTGKSSLKDFNLKKFNKIIICDLAPDLVVKILETVKNKQVLYSDHHPRSTPIPKEILELVTVDQGYIPSSRTAQELTEIKPWLGLAGTLADRGDVDTKNQEYIEKILEQENMTFDEFKKKIIFVMTNTLAYLKDKPNKAFSAISELDSTNDIKKLYQYSQPIEDELQRLLSEYDKKKKKWGDVNFYLIDSKFSMNRQVSGSLSSSNPNQVIIIASEKEDGTISMSGRNKTESISAKKAFAVGTKNLKDARSGGHEAGAGAKIQTKDLEKFKQNIRNFLESNPAK